MLEQLVECVPNFSEGRNPEIIKQITDEIEKVDGVKLLDVDPGYDMNRTVVTFIGSPNSVKEAAFQSIKKASELIDMSTHQGSHPRMGATDVCPFVPVSGISIDETIALSKEVAERVGNELGIPIYMYEKSYLGNIILINLYISAFYHIFILYLHIVHFSVNFVPG